MTDSEPPQWPSEPPAWPSEPPAWPSEPPAQSMQPPPPAVGQPSLPKVGQTPPPPAGAPLPSPSTMPVDDPLASMVPRYQPSRQAQAAQASPAPYPGQPGQVPGAPAPPSRVSTVQAVIESMLIGAAAGIAVGLVVWIVTTMIGGSSCDSGSEGWCGLGWFAIGGAIGLAAAALTYLVAGALWVRQRLESGRRLLAYILHVAVPPGTVTVLAILGSVIDG